MLTDSIEALRPKLELPKTLEAAAIAVDDMFTNALQAAGMYPCPRIPTAKAQHSIGIVGESDDSDDEDEEGERPEDDDDEEEEENEGGENEPMVSNSTSRMNARVDIQLSPMRGQALLKTKTLSSRRTVPRSTLAHPRKPKPIS